jgi:hypothetical protein
MITWSTDMGEKQLDLEGVARWSGDGGEMLAGKSQSNERCRDTSRLLTGTTQGSDTLRYLLKYMSMGLAMRSHEVWGPDSAPLSSAGSFGEHTNPEARSRALGA